MELALDLPYRTPELPGVGGQLRTTPDHFVVEEIPLYPALGEGQHLYVNLTKELLTTRDVQKELASLFSLDGRAVSFAGMKDKYARTTQTFSLNVGHVDDAFVQAAAERIQEALDVQVHWTKLHRNKLKKGHLLGNRFTIAISAFSLPLAEAVQRAETIAEAIRQRGLPNFYGPQRLGQNGANVHRGLELIHGRRRLKDRWLAGLLKASVQSYLCNRYLTHRLESDRFDTLLLGDIAKKYDTGGLFLVEDLAAEQERYRAGAISFTAPIFGPKMWAAEGPAAELEDAVLAESGLTLAQLGKARLTGTRRMGRLLLPDLAVSASEEDESVRVSFSLPKGAFATTVLREMMKVEDDALASLPVDDD